MRKQSSITVKRELLNKFYEIDMPALSREQIDQIVDHILSILAVGKGREVTR
jgi:hypothetical protein